MYSEVFTGAPNPGARTRLGRDPRGTSRGPGAGGRRSRDRDVVRSLLTSMHDLGGGCMCAGALADVELQEPPTGLREALEVDRGVQQLIRKVEPRANRRFAVETDEPLEE